MSSWYICMWWKLISPEANKEIESEVISKNFPLFNNLNWCMPYVNILFFSMYSKFIILPANSPELRIIIPEKRNLSSAFKQWWDFELPIDVLLLTVKDCEFLARYYFRKKPFRSYLKELSLLYVGEDGRNRWHDTAKNCYIAARCGKCSGNIAAKSCVLCWPRKVKWSLTK